jgi:hypothetical protein
LQGCPFNHTPAPQKNANWRDNSKLNLFNPLETAANSAGRLRLNNGILTPTQQTEYLSAATDPSTLDFIFIPDFLDKITCQTLVDAALALADKQAVANITDPYWRGRMLFYKDILAGVPDAAAIMKNTATDIASQLQRYYELTAPVYADVIQLTQWREGMFMAPHSDNEHDKFSYRDFGCIVYLNDDYEGGEFYFTALDKVIKPKAGTLVAFTGGKHHEHAVLTVTKGLRLTMPSFFTFDESKKDRLLYPIA